MLADALQEREMQKEVSKRIAVLDEKREEGFLEVNRQKERELQVKDEQLKKNMEVKVQDFRQHIKGQHQEQIQNYIKDMQEDKIEGEIIKQRAREEKAELGEKARVVRENKRQMERDREEDKRVRARLQKEYS